MRAAVAIMLTCGLLAGCSSPDDAARPDVSERPADRSRAVGPTGRGRLTFGETLAFAWALARNPELWRATRPCPPGSCVILHNLCVELESRRYPGHGPVQSAEDPEVIHLKNSLQRTLRERDAGGPALEADFFAGLLVLVSLVENMSRMQHLAVSVLTSRTIGTVPGCIAYMSDSAL